MWHQFTGSQYLHVLGMQAFVQTCALAHADTQLKQQLLLQCLGLNQHFLALKISAFSFKPWCCTSYSLKIEKYFLL